MKNEKYYAGFLIIKIWQILKRFGGTKTLAKTSYFWRVKYYQNIICFNSKRLNYFYLKITTGSTQIQAPRIAKDGFDLPSARKISTSVAKMENGSDDNLFLDQLQTVLVMQMGQFIDHDITHTPNHGIDCCNKSRNFPSKIFFLDILLAISFLIVHF